MSEKTPVPRFATSDDLKKFIESYTPITIEEAYSKNLSDRQKEILQNEYYRSQDVIRNIIDKNKDVVTYEILDLAYAKDLYGFNVAPKVETKDQVINILNSYNQIGTINTLIDNLPKDIMDDEILHKATDKGYVIHYETPEYLRNNEELIKKSKEDVKVRMLKAIIELPGRYGDYDRYGTYRAVIDNIIISSSKDIIDDEIFELALSSGLSLSDEFIKRKFGNDANKYIEMTKRYSGYADINKLVNYRYSDVIKSLELAGKLDDLVYKAIDNGLKLDSYRPNFMLQFKYILYAIKNGQGDALNYLDLKWNYPTEEEQQQIRDIMEVAINHGYKYTDESPQFIRDFKYIKYAIEKGQSTALYYLNTDNITEEEKHQIDDLVYKAIDNGLKLYSYGSNFMLQFKYIKYAIDKGQEDALYYLNIDSVKDEEKDIFHKYLKKYVTICCINKVMPVINKLNFEDIGIVFNKEQLVAFKYLINYPSLISIYQNETVDNFYKDSIENKKLCNKLFKERNWTALSELIANNDELIGALSKNQIKIISIYIKIDVRVQKIFQDYIINNLDFVNEMSDEKLNLITVVLKRLSSSNSSEMQKLITELATQLLYLDNPIEALDKIEDIFLKNNLPMVGKIYKVFETLHPNLQGFNFSQGSSISPLLLSKSNSSREIIIFADLIKSFMGSNNRNFKKYLKNLEQGNNIFLDLCNHKIEFENLDNETMEILKEFVAHLNTLYNNTKKGKNDNKVLTGDIITDIEELKRLFSPNGNLTYDLPDRIIKMYCHFAGIDTLEQAKKYINDVIKKTSERNIKASECDLKLEQGDFIKGIGDIKYLSNILQNGSVAREFLGSSAGSDLTPLDTDLSIILESNNSVEDAISKTEARSYGPIWFVLKNRDNRFTITRRSPKENNQEIDTKTDGNKLEAFYTGAIGESHYGIRTGFASSEIDYIVTEQYDDRIGFEIARNGFYIPVADKTGKIIFTPQDYDKLRAKMQGLSYYDSSKYELSNDLETPDIIRTSELLERSRQEIEIKRQAINDAIKKAIGRLNLKLKEKVDGNLQDGYVELIDTGSTGRDTNLPGDGDFDYMMRLDNSIISDSNKLSELKEELLKEFQVDDMSGVIGTGDFRLKQVMIKGLDTPVDIDITFTEKTDKLNYSTEMCLKDRLDSIKKQYPDRYNLVIANIIEAKKILKQALAYKPDRGETPQGGLGGVGVENWILQNGGSLKQAAKEFLAASDGKSFKKKKKES